mgnify:CR=1 FL=1
MKDISEQEERQEKEDRRKDSTDQEGKAVKDDPSKTESQPKKKETEKEDHATKKKRINKMLKSAAVVMGLAIVAYYLWDETRDGGAW